MNNNLDPYAAPQTQTTDDLFDGELVPPRKVSGGRGAAWIREGYHLFRLAPGNWILMMLVYWFLIMALSMLPLVSMLVTVIQPVFIGGLFYATLRLDREGKLAVDDLFTGFRQQLGPLAIMGLITLAFSVVIFGGLALAMVGSFGLDLFLGNIDEADMANMDWEPMMLRFVLAMLIGLMLYIPLVMATWFAPGLIMLHNLPVIEAMKMSFSGCLKNIWPFLVYGIVAMLWMILAMLPLFLGLFVFFPVMIASIYCGYRDIFLSGEGAVDA